MTGQSAIIKNIAIFYDSKCNRKATILQVLAREKPAFLPTLGGMPSASQVVLHDAFAV